METASPLRKKLNEELECSLCLDILNNPRVFPQCQHSFCNECIVQLSQRKSKIFCPECRDEVEIGIPPDLSHFKRNARINNILECMNNKNLRDSIKPEITTPICNDGTQAIHRNAGESEAGTSADKQGRPNDALHVEDNPASMPQTSKDIVEMKPAESCISTNPQQTRLVSLQSKLDVGSMVEVVRRHQAPKYGIIRWIALVPNSDKKIVGLELEEELVASTDETFLGKCYFPCPNKRDFFAHLHNCLPDTRFLRNCNDMEMTESETSLDIHRKESRNENQLKLDNQVPKATTHANMTTRDPRCTTSVNAQHMAYTSLQSKLDIGSTVEVLSKTQQPRYGVIRWIGYIPYIVKKIAGLELEEEMDTCTDGTLLRKRYFSCPNRRGLFIHLHECLPDSRFLGNSIENLNHESKRLTKPVPDPRTPTSRNPQQTNPQRISKLDIGSMVEVVSKNQPPKDGVIQWICFKMFEVLSNSQEPRYGVIRWIGYVPNNDKKIAGLELEEEMDACTDGTLLGKRYFTCPNRRGFFIHLHNCLPD